MTGIVSDTASPVAGIRALVETARRTVAWQVNHLAVLINSEVGQRIVLHEQGGEDRAAYGRTVLKTLSEALTAKFGRGWFVSNLTCVDST